ncbi:hypothetical protein MMYC01_206287 [Madurella mycetomatis]|uniref:DUF7136 domain-containing protein n=1 Tax=Madurella mycetomatis TaxID=100816 RepID=A0A175W5R1_9PEZI|nr:hypothetical protein MMYC01_206287 [Madurella mycetomatis]
MHLFSRAAWSLVAPLVYLGAIVDAAGVLEVSLVFPRNDTTYAPTDSMPIIFAFQNAELARYLHPSITYYMRRPWAGRDDIEVYEHDLSGKANWSSHEPYFAYTFFNNFTRQGRWWLLWDLFWDSCDENAEPFGRNVITDRSSYSIEFDIQEGGQVVDLVAATAANRTCTKERGIAINVTDTTMKVNEGVNWRGNDTCVVVASSAPTPTPNPCRVTIDSAVAASMSAAKLCHSLDPPADCPSENVSQRLAVAGMACLLTTLGALSFFLV